MSYKKDLEKMYDLGYKHGYEIAIKEAELERLKAESESKEKELS